LIADPSYKTIELPTILSTKISDALNLFSKAGNYFKFKEE
jgi:hypothetical protein